MILSPSELAELTGKVRFKAQGKVLAALGVPFKSRPDGSIVVYRDDLTQKTVKPRRRPDFSVLATI